VPDLLCRLTNLTTLALHGNRITKLPLAVGQLQQLRELTLQGNRVTRLPGSLSCCTNLEVLDLRNNALVLLPPGIGQLGKLRKLELARNKLTALPASMKDLPESLAVDVMGNNGLQSPPFALAKQGIQAIRRYFASDAHKEVDPASPIEEVVTPSAEHRQQMMLERGPPPAKLDGSSSRHNWVKANEWLVLLFNCHAAPCEVSGGDVCALSPSEAYELMVADDSSEAIGAIQPGSEPLLERVHFHNAWARGHVDTSMAAAESDFIVHAQLWLRGAPLQPPVYLRVYPHTAYGARIGTRCELHKVLGPQADVITGSATVQEILDDDRCVVRLDNVGIGTSGEIVSDRVVVDLRPDSVLRTQRPQYKPGVRLIVLHNNRCYDAVVHRSLSLNLESKSRAKHMARPEDGTRHELLMGLHATAAMERSAVAAAATLAQSPAAAAAPADARGATDALETLDLNQYNHCRQRQLPSGEWLTWSRYEQARVSYCEALLAAFGTVRELTTGHELQTELQQAVWSVRDRGGSSEFVKVQRLSDVAAVFAKPSEGRARGARADIKCILKVQGHGFEHVWALRHFVSSLIRVSMHDATARSVSEGSKTFKRKVEQRETAQLVPLVISMRELQQKLRTAPQTTTLGGLVATGQLCSWYIDHCTLVPAAGRAGGATGEADEDETRAMLQHALEMRALVVILDPDDSLHERDGASLSQLVHTELLPSVNRLLLLCYPKAMDEAEQQGFEASFTLLQLRSLQLNLRGCELLDSEGARLISAISSGSSFSTDVTALHLGHNSAVGYDSGRMMAELLKSKSTLQWLDLQATSIDGRSLAYAIKMNAALTYLDVRDTRLWDDAVFLTVGSSLLVKGCVSRLSYLRCADYELLPGMSTLNLQEHTLGVGTLHLLAALLRRNSELTELDLTATDMDERAADAFSLALEENTSLKRLALRYNHLDEETERAVRGAARAGVELLI